MSENVFLTTPALVIDSKWTWDVATKDNARPHVARLVAQHLANANIQHLKWPSVSLDLSPIEHMWDELERRLRQRDNQPQSL